MNDPRLSLSKRSALLALLVTAAFSCPAYAGVVTNTNDSGPGSLRQVIADAASGETITFSSSLAGQTIALSSVGDNVFGPSALLVNKTLIIVGPTGNSGINIARAPGAPEMRLVRVTSGVQLTLRYLTLSGGVARGGNGASAHGGGGGGGGGLGGAVFNEGTLQVENSTLSGNSVIGGNGGDGGVESAGNFNGGNGGGPNGGAGGMFFPGNGATGGFGGGGGGGDSQFGEFDGSYGGAGGLGGGGGGGGRQGADGSGGRGSFAPLTGALGGHNRGGGGGGLGLGGAILNKGGTVGLVNSTISDNITLPGAGGASQSGGGAGASGAAAGGAVLNYNGALSIVNSTLAGNAGIYTVADGGNASVLLVNTILDDIAFQIFGGNGTYNTSGNNNLIRSNNGFSGGVISNADPLLGPLQNNGGPTATRALPLSSVAVDAGDDNVSYAQDQRGSARRSRAHVDIGAYELQNLGPSAVAQSVATNQATPLQITFAGSDPEGDALTYEVTSNPAHGTLSAISGNSVTYTPAASHHGSDSFAFRAVDAYGANSSPATVSITINGAPTAAAQSVLTNQDTAKAIALAATDPEGDTFTFSIVTNPAHGTLSAISGSEVTYTPAAGYHGADSFTFRATDSKGAAGASATVSITVNGAPVAVNQSAALVRGSSKTLTLGANDPEGDARTLSIVNAPAHGTLSAISGNQVTYTPNTGYEGSDSFTFRATDSKGAVGPTATVTLTIVSPLIVTSAGDATVADEIVTLREAIAFAESNAGADNITFNLPGAGPHVINLLSGLTISTDLTIEAPVGQQVTVQPQNADGAFLLVRITAGAVTFTRLTFLSAPGGSFSTPGASGIHNSGSLTLGECRFSNHRSQRGAIQNDGALTLSDCVFASNSSAFGAAIYSNAGTVNATRCVFSGNTSSGAGGAVGFFASGSAALSDSTFIDNVATGASGGALAANVNVTLRNCTFSNNRSPMFSGGAVVTTPGGTLWVLNCTFSGNRAADSGGAIRDEGTVHLRSTTMTANSLTTSFSSGGGLFSKGTATLQNTVIAGNTASIEADVSVSAAASSLGHNFIGRHVAGGTFTAPGDQQGSNASPLDPKLGTLQDNGGYTQTVAPLPNSPLIDKGKRSSDAAGALISSDQRSAGRPVDLGGFANAAGGDGTDTGAVELPASIFPTADDQNVTTAEDTAKSITLSGSAPGGGALTYQVVTPPVHGTLSAIAGDQVTYTPAANYSGSDSFTFRAVTANGASSHNAATVSITITPAPDAPVAANQSVVAAYGTSINITLGATDADGDALTFAIVTGPAHGALSTLNGNQISYTPASGYSGPDSFTFKANDRSADSNIATVSITVTDPPSLVVTVLNDTINHNDGQTSLREAVAYAATLGGNPTITFAPFVNGTIVLGSTLAITSDLTITGPGANLLAISGNNAVRVFSVAAGKTVNLTGLTIANGRLTANGQSGAGISNAGTLNVSACAFTGNRVHGIADAGAIHNNGGVLTVTNSTFASNYAAFGGGGVRNESGATSLTNCTFVGNLAGSGGAVQHINGTLALRFCTLTGNTSFGSAGGGVQSQNGHTLRLNHTIVSGNEGGDTSGVITDDGFNLIGGSVALDTLKDNGGAVQTVALLRNSPALDAGDPAFASPPETDARGAGFARKLGQRVDIGAFESVAAPLAGRSGSAIRFDGVDDYVQLPDDLFPYPSPRGASAPISFEAFFKTTSGGVILGQQTGAPFDDNQNGWVPAIYVGTNGRLHVVMFHHAADPAVMESSAPVNDGAWHHVAVTYDGTSERFYLDGALQSSRNVAQVGYSEHYKYQLGTGRTTFWPNDNGTWYPFNGMLDEVRIWNRARTSTEIASSWNKSLGGGEAGLLAYYRFDETSGSTAVDHSGNGNTGALFNGAAREATALLSGDYINDARSTTLRDTAVNGTLVAFDAANLPLTFSKVTDPSHGAVVVNGDGSFTYTPANGYTGPDSFSFMASTSARISNTASFTIDVVAPPNAAPTAVADAMERYPYRSASIAEATLLANDSDADGNLPLTIVSVSAPASGQASVARGNGYVFYDPNPDFTGADTFTYTVADALGATSTATVSVGIASGTPPSNLPTVILETVAAGRQSRIGFTGVPGRTYRVQFTDRIEPELANWQTLQTVTADANGVFEIIDPPPLPPQRFYRVVYP